MHHSDEPMEKPLLFTELWVLNCAVLCSDAEMHLEDIAATPQPPQRTMVLGKDSVTAGSLA